MSTQDDSLFEPSVKQRLDQLNIKLFADGADINDMLESLKNPYIKGFTTNPSLMRSAGIADYESFGRDVLKAIHQWPVSFEVFSDEPDEMLQQARYIASWGNNVNIKIPVTNSRGEFMGPVIRQLSKEGVCLNITAVMTLDQVNAIADVLSDKSPAIISIFAGRIADTGIDPADIFAQSVARIADRPNIELLWASPRELFNIFQADQLGCHIITVSSGFLKKLSLIGKNLDQYSLETVTQFYQDAQSAGYQLGAMPDSSLDPSAA
jgi:transaldolase